MFTSYLSIEMVLWALHPMETRASEADYNNAFETALSELEGLETQEAKNLHVQLPLWLEKRDKKSVYETLSQFVKKELYTS